MGSYRLEPVVSVLRLYHGSDNSYDAQSAAEVNVQHVLPGVWAMSAHRGTHSRSSLRALLKAAIDNNVHLIIADRSTNHKLPGAKPRQDGQGFDIDVKALANLLHMSAT